jgi:L-amino acid N-acyltransferase YncA
LLWCAASGKIGAICDLLILTEAPMTTPLLRAATAADIPAIAAIYRPAVLHGTASFELDPPSDAEMLRRFTDITAGGYPYIVAELDGRVLGYAYASAYRTRPAYRFTVENSVYVAENAQGKGVGAMLMKELVAVCVAKGYRLMIAVIGDSRNHASITLHRNAGFTFCGTMHSIGHKHGRWLDTVIMELRLGEGDRTPPGDRGVSA